jgi:hypothetical protein
VTPGTAADAAEWIDANDVYTVIPNPPGYWWVEFHGVQVQHSDAGLIDLAQRRQQYIAAGPDAWLGDTKEE